MADARRRDDGEELRRMMDRTDIMAVYERLTGKSSNGLRTGRGVLVHCPTGSHSDTHQSCSINPAKKAFHSFCCEVPGTHGRNGGGVLDLIVFAGKANSRHEAALWLKDSGLVGYDFDYRASAPLEIHRGNGRGGRILPPSAKVSAIHPYPNADGELRYQVERVEWPSAHGGKNEKTFRQLHVQTEEGPHCTTCSFALRTDLEDLAGANARRTKMGAPYGLSPEECEQIGTAAIRVPAHGEARTLHGVTHEHDGRRHCDICTKALADDVARSPRLKTWKSIANKYGLTANALKDLVADPAFQAPAHPGVLRWGMEGVERFPYKLPAVMAAARAGKPVFYVEGEKCADVLESLGFAATTNAGGASWSVPMSWGRYFAGANPVIIIPDCDVAGRRAAVRRYRALRAADVPTIIMDLDPSPDLRARRTDKYDIADWVAERAGRDPAALRAELRAVYRAALDAQKIPQFLIVNAHHMRPRNPDACRYIHASVDEAPSYLAQVPFDGVYVGPGLGPAFSSLSTAILDNGAPTIKFHSTDTVTAAAYEQRRLAYQSTLQAV